MRLIEIYLSTEWLNWLRRYQSLNKVSVTHKSTDKYQHCYQDSSCGLAEHRVNRHLVVPDEVHTFGPDMLLNSQHPMGIIIVELTVPSGKKGQRKKAKYMYRISPNKNAPALCKTPRGRSY